MYVEEACCAEVIFQGSISGVCLAKMETIHTTYRDFGSPKPANTMTAYDQFKEASFSLQMN